MFSSLVVLLFMVLIIPVTVSLLSEQTRFTKNAFDPASEKSQFGSFQGDVLFTKDLVTGVSPTPAPDQKVNIVFKYRNELKDNLPIIDENTKSQSTDGNNVSPLFKNEKLTTKERVDLNLQKYPKRQKRIAKNVEIPDLTLLRTISVDQNKATQILKKLQSNKNIEYAEIEKKPEPQAVGSPNDFFYNTNRNSSVYDMPDLWGLRKIGLNPVGSTPSNSGWDKTQGSDNVVVAVYGTGLNYNHLDLQQNAWVNPGEDINHNGVIWDKADLNGIDDDNDGHVDDLMGWNFNENNNNVYDDGSFSFGHDTYIAGMIGAIGNNSYGSTGVNWKVKLMPLKGGNYNDTIKYAVDHGADVVNISWTLTGFISKDIVDYAYANGVIVVFSSGNDSQDLGYLYDTSDRAWVVGATDINDNRATYSTYGERLDFTAPGNTILGTIPVEIKGRGIMTKFPSFSTANNLSGTPYLASYNPENHIFSFGSIVNNTWGQETIPVLSDISLYPSLAFNKYNVAFLSYYDWQSQKLMLATRNSLNLMSPWSIQPLTNTNDQGYFSSLKIGTDGYPRIAYLDKTINRLKLLTPGQNGFTEEDIASIGGIDLYYSKVSLGLDTNNNPYISYYKKDTADLMFAFKRNGVWTVETVDGSGNVGYSSALTLDSNNIPHIVYTNGDNWTLKYANKKNNVWTVSTILGQNKNGIYENSIIIDNNNIYVASQTDTSGALSISYLVDSGQGFVTQNVTSVNNDLGYLHQLVVKNNVPTIVASSNKRGLFLATNAGSGWTTSLLTDWGNPFGYLQGTSAAAPYVSGLAALMISAHPDWNIAQIYYAIAKSAKELGTAGHDPYFGWGRIDANAALNMATPPVDNLLPSASISSPADNSQLAILPTIEIKGTANDENFNYYNLFYKKDTDTSWTNIAYFIHQPKNNEVLGTWTTNNYTGGKYQIKLESHDWFNTTTAISNVTIITPTPTPSPTPVPSANGKIVFAEIYAIKTVEPNGANVYTLYNGFGQNPSWTFDGKKIVFAANRTINTITLPEGVVKNVLPTQTSTPIIPIFTPDGKTILYSNSYNGGNYRIFKVNSDGSNFPNLVFDEASATASIYPSAVSYDGTKMLYQRSDTDWTGAGGLQEIWMANIDGTNRVKAVNLTGKIKTATFSPDGTYIVYTAQIPGSSYYKLYKTVLATQNTQRITPEGNSNEDYPSFSPDGKTIIFSARLDTGKVGLYKINIDGTNYTKIYEPALSLLYMGFHAWAPDINYIPSTPTPTPTKIPTPTVKPTPTFTPIRGCECTIYGFSASDQAYSDKVMVQWNTGWTGNYQLNIVGKKSWTIGYTPGIKQWTETGLSCGQSFDYQIGCYKNNTDGTKTWCIGTHDIGSTIPCSSPSVTPTPTYALPTPTAKLLSTPTPTPTYALPTPTIILTNTPTPTPKPQSCSCSVYGVDASDGLYPNKVNISWKISGGGANYQLNVIGITGWIITGAVNSSWTENVPCGQSKRYEIGCYRMNSDGTKTWCGGGGDLGSTKACSS